MEGISRKDLDRACVILEKDVKIEEGIKLAKIIREFDIIPKLYVYTFLKRFVSEIKDVKTTTVEDLESEMLEGLSLDIVTKSNLTGIQELLRIAFNRENYICDFDDTRNAGTMFGQCQNEDHEEPWDEDKQEVRKMEDLSLVLMPDEFNKKFDEGTAEYWCKDCCEQAECDVEVSCDMDIGE